MRPAGFGKVLALGLEHGQWIRLHYHQIGSSVGLGISEENFLAVQEMIKQHQKDLWIAGMADIFMYYTERESAKLTMTRLAERKLQIVLSCMTDKKLYEQPLTLQLTLPKAWSPETVQVTDGSGNRLETRLVEARGRRIVRFEVDPVGSTFTVRFPGGHTE